jgi:hypothetical protein
MPTGPAACPNCGATTDGGGEPVIILPMYDCCGKLACNVCSCEGFVCPHCEGRLRDVRVGNMIVTVIEKQPVKSESK